MDILVPGKDQCTPTYTCPVIDQEGLIRTLEGRSSKWPEKEKQFLQLQNMCQACGCAHDLQVHHKIPFHIKPELELVDSNLMTVCEPHHLLFGHLMLWAAYNPDVETDTKLWREKIKNRKRTL